MRLTDPRAMRALAHPLRLDLLELLTVEGPLTAARCADRLDSTQASCSFHLRQLEKYGFVHALKSDDRRERPWALVAAMQEWSAAEDGPAVAHLDGVFVRREADRRLAWVGGASAEPRQWREAAFFGGATLPFTTHELAELRDALWGVLEPYRARLADRSSWPSGARPVRLLLGATPLPAGSVEEDRP